jgi:hypothetical protein
MPAQAGLCLPEQKKTGRLPGFAVFSPDGVI